MQVYFRLNMLLYSLDCPIYSKHVVKYTFILIEFDTKWSAEAFRWENREKYVKVKATVCVCVRGKQEARIAQALLSSMHVYTF